MKFGCMQLLSANPSEINIVCVLCSARHEKSIYYIVTRVAFILEHGEA
jgi:hypothetical protein